MTETRPRAALRDAQRFIAGELDRRENVLLVSGMGSGKSAGTLTALRKLLDLGEVARVLVVAPLRVANDTWPDEIDTWAHTRALSYAVCTGSEPARLEALAARAEITIINRENLPWLWEVLNDGNGWDFDCVVIDESSMFKAGKKRTKLKKLTRFGVLARARPKIKRVIELTGTPAPNGLADLWGQIYLLDQGDRLGASRTAFLNRWFDTDRFTYKVTPMAHAEKEIMGLISDLMISMPDAKLVEPPVFIPVPVKLTPAVMKEYRKFERTLVSQIYDVEAVSKGVLTNKLLQFANGSMYREDGSVVAVHRAKLEALHDLIEQAQGENVIVFYGFKFDLAEIRAAYPQAVVLNESETAVKDWNEGRIKVLLAHPASCAHGLNLQYGGHIAIWYGLTWSLELYQQANARLPRPGQKSLVAIYLILAEGTADMNVVGVLGAKGTTQDAVIDAVRVRLMESST